MLPTEVSFIRPSTQIKPLQEDFVSHCLERYYGNHPKLFMIFILERCDGEMFIILFGDLY